MASFDPIDHFGHDEAPPRPTTPPVRRGFLLVLLGLSLVAGLVYGIPFVVERAGYAYEAGRARAAEDALSRLEKQGKIANASSLFRLAAARVSPAVVNIRSFRAKNANDPPAAPNLVPVGIGSGVVIDASRGLIVTNHHVINHGEQFFVRPSRGGEWPAQIVGMDPATDLAVLQVKAPVQVEAEWGSSETLAVGDWVLAIGSPFNLDQSVSAGIVSATERSRMGVVGDDSYENFIQTDAAVNPGNSGGPLIDLRGKIVGINTAISTEGGGANGIGLAIPVSLARKVAEDLISKGRVSRGYLGVVLKDLSASDAAELKVPDGLGAYIDDLDPEGPAQSAGLQRGGCRREARWPADHRLRQLAAQGDQPPDRLHRASRLHPRGEARVRPRDDRRLAHPEILGRAAPRRQRGRGGNGPDRRPSPFRQPRASRRPRTRVAGARDQRQSGEDARGS